MLISDSMVLLFKMNIGGVMKKFFKLLILVGVFCDIIGAEKPIIKAEKPVVKAENPVIRDAVKPAVQKKPIIISDFDEVWIHATGLIGALGHLEPIKSSLTARTNPDKLNDFTLRLLDAGRNDAGLLPYIPQLIEYMGKSRRINQPI